MCYNVYGDDMSDLELDAYYSQIRNYHGEDVLSVLPNKNVFGFEEAMIEITARLQEELATAVSFLDEALSEEERQYTLEEIDDLKKKIDICDSQLYQIDDLNQSQRIIFSKTEAGNFSFVSDFKKLKREKYDEIRKIMSFINGSRDDKSTFMKIMTNNAKLKGVIEYKTSQDQVRVYAKRIRGNIIYLFGMVVKKDDWTKQIHETLESRMPFVNSSFKALKKKDDRELQELVDESQESLNDILKKLGIIDTEASQSTDDEEIEVLDINEGVKEDLEVLSPEEWNFVFRVAKEIYDEKGFVDLSDPRAQEIDLGSWLDQQNRNIISGKIPNEQLQELLTLISSNNTRRDKVTSPKEDMLLTKTINNIYESLHSLSSEDQKRFEESLENHSRHK